MKKILKSFEINTSGLVAGGETAGIPYAAIISEKIKKPMLYVRKKQKSQKTVLDDEKTTLKKRATFTSVLLCIVFSYLYVSQVFN